MVLNNGMLRDAHGHHEPNQVCMGVVTGAYSDVLEVKFPRDEAGLLQMGGKADITWRYNSDHKDDFYTPFMGGAYRLPNGNTILLQGCDKRIVEVTPDGEIVMDFYPGGPGRMFRVYKYAPDDTGIKALGL